MLNHWTKLHTPWHIITSDQKWYRNMAVIPVIVDTMKRMNLRYRKSDDLSGMIID